MGVNAAALGGEACLRKLFEAAKAAFVAPSGIVHEPGDGFASSIVSPALAVSLPPVWNALLLEPVTATVDAETLTQTHLAGGFALPGLPTDTKKKFPTLPEASGAAHEDAVSVTA